MCHLKGGNKTTVDLSRIIVVRAPLKEVAVSMIGENRQLVTDEPVEFEK